MIARNDEKHISVTKNLTMREKVINKDEVGPKIVLTKPDGKTKELFGGVKETTKASEIR